MRGIRKRTREASLCCQAPSFTDSPLSPPRGRCLTHNLIQIWLLNPNCLDFRQRYHSETMITFEICKFIFMLMKADAVQLFLSFWGDTWIFREINRLRRTDSWTMQLVSYEFHHCSSFSLCIFVWFNLERVKWSHPAPSCPTCCLSNMKTNGFGLLVYRKFRNVWVSRKVLEDAVTGFWIQTLKAVVSFSAQ